MEKNEKSSKRNTEKGEPTRKGGNRHYGQGRLTVEKIQGRTEQGSRSLKKKQHNKEGDAKSDRGRGYTTSKEKNLMVAEGGLAKGRLPPARINRRRRVFLIIQSGTRGFEGAANTNKFSYGEKIKRRKAYLCDKMNGNLPPSSGQLT